jgi:hypothetical protein
MGWNVFLFPCFLKRVVKLVDGFEEKKDKNDMFVMMVAWLYECVNGIEWIAWNADIFIMMFLPDGF